MDCTTSCLSVFVAPAGFLFYIEILSLLIRHHIPDERSDIAKIISNKLALTNSLIIPEPSTFKIPQIIMIEVADKKNNDIFPNQDKR